MDRVVELDDWLADFPEEERLYWNSPNTLYRIAHSCRDRRIEVWRLWRAARDAGATDLSWFEWRGTPDHSAAKASLRETAEANAEKTSNEPGSKDLPGSWSNLLTIADKAIAYASAKPTRLPMELAEPGNLATLREGGEALLKIVSWFETEPELVAAE